MPANPETPLVRLESLSRDFLVGDETVHALDEVTLDIARGEYVAVMGPSGSGKSTLLNIVGLLDRPTRGRYLLDGEDTTTLSDTRQAAVRSRKIGFVFQAFHLVPRLTARENIELPLMLAGTPPEERRPRVASALESFGLADRASHRPDQLSGGQRQRVAIARATITSPEVILADEPTGNLDSVSGADVISTLERLNGEGMTLVVVTHDAEVGGRARRLLRFHDGRLAGDEAQL
ncbi:MAG TPA: ABC transporter ATP-binding protein [Gammaproteobacteria bacterium]|nr:ABC transporter ATP-binding protein [Gammaproteobacteria bacterium]